MAMERKKAVTFNIPEEEEKVARSNGASYHNTPCRTPDVQSTNGDIAERPKIVRTLLYSLLSLLLCLPIGVLSLKNAFKVYNSLKVGHKSVAVRYNDFVRNLFSVAIVVGGLFWLITTLFIVVHLVILKK